MMTTFNENEETALVRENSRSSLVGEPKPEAEGTLTANGEAYCNAGSEPLLTDHEKLATLVPIEISEVTEEQTKVPMDELQTNGKAEMVGQVAFAGMGKEELMKYANKPFWVRLRWALFILFWIAWIFMLAGAIVIIVLAPKCKPLPELSWWQKSPIYQVYPRSFKDTNDDGVGDLQGISSKLDYIDIVMGIKSFWLSPIYKSPNLDNGYDVSNFIDIDPSLGTMEHFDELIQKKKSNGMNLIMDFIPNHSSDQHDWFLKSVEKEDPYKDYYIWADPVDGKPPTNWKSVFGGSSWEWNEKRQQYYYHQFLKEQPDLNLRNSLVLAELDEVLKFWLDKGVDGFRVDAASHLFESAQLLDEPTSNEPTATNPEDYAYLDHIYTKDLDENLEVIKRWKDLLKTYEESDGHHRLLICEVTGDLEKTMQYYGVCDFPFNFELINSLRDSVTGNDVNKTVGTWLEKLPQLAWPNWVLGSHDQSRIASRVGQPFVDAFNMLIMMLPGTPITYYGEEIGMEDFNGISFEDTKDTAGKVKGPLLYKKYSRDPFRTPMQWSSEKFAGFSTVKPWLPLNPNYVNINVHSQKQSPKSHLSKFAELVRLRRTDALKFGSVDFPVVTDDVFSLARVKEGTSGYLLVINFSPEAVTVDFTNSTIPNTGILEMRSSNLTSLPQTRSSVALTDLSLEPREAVLISIVPKSE